ncbi:hypothetical protein BGZ57DRAFT_402654 [Hyaloscypha finlandica]|nr:hypothetical protein BGZ57DRAFT_402654 [Hyaloscypha finlandica]
MAAIVWAWTRAATIHYRSSTAQNHIKRSSTARLVLSVQSIVLALLVLFTLAFGVLVDNQGNAIVTGIVENDGNSLRSLERVSNENMVIYHRLLAGLVTDVAKYLGRMNKERPPKIKGSPFPLWGCHEMSRNQQVYEVFLVLLDKDFPDSTYLQRLLRDAPLAQSNQT